MHRDKQDAGATENIAPPRLRLRGRLHHTPRAAPAFLLRRGIVRGRQVNRRSKQAAAFFSALFILLAAGLLFAPPSHAQQTQAPATTQSPAAAPPPTGQVQGYTLTPGQEAQAIAYAHARHELYFLDVAYGLLLLVLMLQLRVAPAYRDWATKWTDSSFGQIVVFAPLLLRDDRCPELAHRALGTPPGLAVSAVDSGMGIVARGLGQGRGRGDGDRDFAGVGFVRGHSQEPRENGGSGSGWRPCRSSFLGAVVEPLIVEPLFFKFTPLASSEPHLAATSSR